MSVKHSSRPQYRRPVTRLGRWWSRTVRTAAPWPELPTFQQLWDAL